ncbi:MAG: bifunctional folylpolyglutamate synthase/dihydrofolate synthase [Bacteroidales bacterium]|nr:bifunctional folylpolyglutamate synthase/dihydrofolate synthase [Bacteroidales bacterium]
MEIYSDKAYEDLTARMAELFPSVQTGGFNSSTFKPGLDRMMAAASLLGNPQDKYKTVHVAGTNGKGSVANMLTSVYGALGRKTGLYTSPHILDFRERMRIIDGESSYMVQKEYVFGFLSKWTPTFKEMGLSFFEVTTLMAFCWFADEGVDAAVIEVGLGGRLDSTNIITPELSVITSIGLDHCAILGDTRAEIAGEKAGIIKEGVPAVAGEKDGETSGVFTKVAGEKSAPLYFAPDGRMPESFDSILSSMDLQGEYQRANLRTVLVCLDVLGIGLDDKIISAIEHTAARMDFHGRWEKLSDSPLTICDIGHNPPALTKNFAQLREMLSDGRADSLIIVYGVMADKDFESIAHLMPAEADYILTAPSSQRSLPAEELGRKFSSFVTGCKSMRVVPKVPDAVAAARDMAASRKKPLIYIGGSTFVVSEAISL